MPAALLLTLTVSGCATGAPWDQRAGTAAAPPRVASPAAAGPRPAPTDQSADSATVVLVAALRGLTPVSVSPGGPQLTIQPGQTDERTAQRLLVLRDRGDWLEVALPGRPNGRTGWIRAGAADLSATDWRLRVSLGMRRLAVLRSGMVYAQYRVAVGKAATPTTKGLFFVTDLLAPPDPAGAYGPYAFGLSAYSNVITRFVKAGKGQTGLHGTNAPGSIGKPVSNGCLRLDNDTVAALARQLPLGTPVEIAS